MKRLTTAALCAGLAALPLSGRAADYLLFGPSDEPVAIMVPIDSSPRMMMPPGFPADLFAQQAAMMNQMLSNLRAMDAAVPFGAAGFPAVMPQQAGLSGGTIVVSSFSSGHGTCSRTVTYEGRPNAAPVVQVRQTGDACGALPPEGQPGTVPAALPDTKPEAAPEPAVLNTPHLIRVDYRHPERAAATHRG